MKKVLLVVVASTVVIAGCSGTKKPSQESMIKPIISGTGTLSKEQIDTLEKDKQIQQDVMKKKVTEVMMQKNEPVYTSYNELTAKSLAAAGKHVVLFFHAGRCPTCKALDTEVTTKLSTLQSNSVVLKIDYDNSADLKKKYLVTSQHTLVRVDKDMNLVAKQTGGDVESIKVLLQ